MSWQAVKAVLDKSKAKRGARLLLIAIAEHAHDDGTDSYPSLATLQRETGMGRTTVCRHLKTLVSSGEVERVKGGGRSRNVYRVTLLSEQSASGTSADLGLPKMEQQQSHYPNSSSSNGGTAAVPTGDHKPSVPPASPPRTVSSEDARSARRSSLRSKDGGRTSDYVRCRRPRCPHYRSEHFKGWGRCRAAACTCESFLDRDIEDRLVSSPVIE